MSNPIGAESPEPGPPIATPSPLRSVHTTSFTELLRKFGASVAVSTYQAGKLVILRPGETALNTHFRTFAKPMGIAVAGGRLAIGTAAEIWEFHNVPAICEKLDKPTDEKSSPSEMPHDAAFLPRQVSFTGNVQIHEMAWAGKNSDELWFVNTRFSCLCTRSLNYSFIPRWRPSFITHLAPQDRCHLNGLALRENVPRYVTALGNGNEPGAWRSNKKSGGIVIDIPTQAIICSGLSMPHSPRWYDNKLFVLSSGDGEIGQVDLANGNYQTIASLPGFTRGLDFLGPYAFIGLSQIRETAVFSGIAIADRPAAERFCGVWVVDLRNGQTVGFVKFEDGVQEIFAVQILPNARWPDVVMDNRAVLNDSFVLPDNALADVDPEQLTLRRMTEPGG